MTRRTLVFPFAVALLLGAGALGLRGAWPWTRLSDIPTLRPIVVTSPFRIVRDTLHGGESVAALLHRQGITGLDLTALARALRLDPTRIRAGLVFFVRRDGTTGAATNVEFRPNPAERLRFVRTSAGEWTAESVPIRWTTDTIRCSLMIDADHTNLYAASNAGVCDGSIGDDERERLVDKVADINAYTVDFSRDLQPGDRIVTVLERLVSEEGEVRVGSVLGTSETVGKRNFETFGYPDDKGGLAYYDASGTAVKRSFLISPVDFRYITSGFSRSRFHPILGLWRKHEGVDYAAGAGSPVKAAGDGTVTVAGWAGDYGKLVEIRHRNGVITRYGHLHDIPGWVRPGTHVSQSDVIGHVGMTGLATGPHLHYEFRVDGKARDPRSIKSEPGAPLPASRLADFQRRRALLAELLARGSAATPITE